MPRSVALVKWTWPRVALLAAVLVYLGGLLVLPLGALATQTAGSGFASLLSDLSSPDALHALFVSLVLAAIAAVVNGVVGVAAAIVFVRHRFVGRRVLDAVADMPLTVSPVMVGLAFLLIFGRDGYLAPMLEILDFKVTFAFAGLVIATLFVTLPFTLREVSYVLEELGTEEEEAAAILGGSAWQTFRLVTLPNIRHALAYGITLTVARSLGEFGAVLILGGAISGKTQTATTFINVAMEERREPAAYGMALVLAVASIALLLVLEALKKVKEKA
ncbi:MAG: sulfate ABC transporter permease subunit [Deltaproteobacteria bacterium]|nr:sulfate ABC transporter permease subunit [Deltaproteobacteria bacterium]